MYASLLGKRFQLEHCWVILRKEPKWQFERASQHQKSNKKQKSHGIASPASSNPSTPDSASLGDDSDAFLYQKRPIEQKAAKERLRRRQGKEKVDETSISKLLDEFKEFKYSIEQIEDKKNQHRLTMLEQQAIIIKQNEDKREDEIMKTDTSCMDPISAVYFQNRKLEIMTKKGFNL